MTLLLRVENIRPDNSVNIPRDGWVKTEDDLAIGRAADNGLVLDDPANTISNHHCQISRSDTGFVLVDKSRNGTFMNGHAQPLSRETPVPLNAGDVLHIGLFSLHVLSADVTHGAPMESRGSSTREDAGAEEAGLLGPVAPRIPVDAHLGVHDRGTRRDRLEERLVIEAESYDSDETDTPNDLDYGLLSHGETARIPASGSQNTFTDRAADAQMVFVQPRIRIESIPDDWDIMDEMSQRPAPLGPRAEDEPHGGAVDREVRPTTSGPAAKRIATDDNTDGAAVDAFLSACGLGIDDCRSRDLVAVMGRAGSALRASVDGLQALLEEREANKHGLPLDRAVIGRTGNNPLKFIPDGHDAIAVMLLATIPGFLSADLAVQQAFADVASYQAALIGARQESVADLFRRLAPQAIKQAAAPLTVPQWINERFFAEQSAIRWWKTFHEVFDAAVVDCENITRGGGRRPASGPPAMRRAAEGEHSLRKFPGQSPGSSRMEGVGPDARDD